MQDSVYMAFCKITLSFLNCNKDRCCFTLGNVLHLLSEETKEALKFSPGGSRSNASELWQATLPGHGRASPSLC